LTGGSGSDVFQYTAIDQSSGATVDTITDFSTTDDQLQVTLNYGSLISAVTVNAIRVTAGAGVTEAQASLTGERGQYVYDTTASKLYVNVNNDNLLTALDYAINVNAASTATATVANTDINFIVTGTALADVISTDGGNDTISGGTGGDSITAGAGNDSITGGTGADTMNGGDGADTIVSGGGTDSINGGAGIDVITGGGGTDTIVVGTVESSVDAIGTFTSGTDKVRFSGAILNVADAAITNAGDLSGKATIDAAITVSATATQYVFSNAAFDIDAVLTAFLAAPTAANAAAVTTAAMTALNATTKSNLDATFVATETVLFILDGTTGTSGAVFTFNNANAAAAGNTIDAGELVLVGVTDVVLVNGDVIL
jgi:Ca2+-binding RTX toxin-like protein